MSWWKEILKRSWYLGRRSQFEEELDDEIRFHIETRAEELQSEGVPQAQALERAWREFGPRARASEDSRNAWQFQWCEDFRRDLRYAARAFAKNPGFASVAMLSLGIGVGANCAMFSIVDAALLRPPRVPRANEMVALVSTAKQSDPSTVSYPDYLDVRDRSRSFQTLGAFTGVSSGFAAHAGVEPRVKDGKLVTANFFEVVGVGPEIGRPFLPQEEQIPGNDLMTILSYKCWQEDFGADAAVLGKPARINGIDFTIVGVMPQRFTDVDDDLSDDHPSFYVPVRAAARIGSTPDLIENRGQRTLTVFGRLKRGVPMAQARAEIATVAGVLAREYPATDRDRKMTVQTVLQYRGSGGATVAGSLAMVLSGIVLLVACANVAGLLTSRAPARAQEIAMRLAIGAARPRLIRQLLTESLLLAAGGALAGVALGYIPIALARRIKLPGNPPPPMPLEMNERVLLFSVAIALVSVILFGLTPAFQATRTDLMTTMKSPGSFGQRRGWMGKLFRGRNVLVAGQVAISVLLLTTTTVLYVSLYKTFLTSIRHPTIEVDHLLGLDFDPATVHYKDARAGQFFKALAQGVRARQSVRSATVWYQDAVKIRPDSPVVHDNVTRSGVWVDVAYFDTFGIPILRGRAFRAADLYVGMGGASLVAVVNDVLAEHYWPGQNAIGRQIRLGADHLSGDQWLTVIGVAKMSNYLGLSTPAIDLVFLPYGLPYALPSGAPKPDVILVVRSARDDPYAPVESIRTAIRDLDPDQAVPSAETWQSTVGTVNKFLSLAMNTIGAMGVLGLGLALVGLYGLLAYDVSARTREIGIRMALGARAGAVVRMVLRQGIALAVCGVGAGVGLNFAVVKIAEAMLGPGNTPKPQDPNAGAGLSFQLGTAQFGDGAFWTLMVAVFAVTLLAAYLPARRAARVDPNVALRAE